MPSAAMAKDRFALQCQGAVDDDRKAADDRKVTDFVAKRRLFESGKGPVERGS